MPTKIMPDGTGLYYEDFGTGVPIVFVPSGNATHAMWEEQVVALAPGHRVITIDWRGTGKSDRPRDGYTAEQVVDDVASLVRDIVGGPAIFVGHGMGGHIALLAAHRYPELVSGIGVASSGPWYCGDRDGKQGGMSQEFVESSASGTGLSYTDVLANMTDTLLFRTPVSEMTRTATILQQLEWPLYVLDQYDLAMRELDHRDYLPSLTQPAVVLHGRHDVKQRFEGAGVLVEELPNAELVVFENSAHCPHAEETDKFNSALADLIARVEALAYTDA